MKKFLKILLFVFSLFSQFIVLLTVIHREVNTLTLVFWVISLFFFYFSFPFQVQKLKKKKTEKNLLKTYLPGLAIILIALALRLVLMSNANAFHGDEYLTAYFSYSLPDFSKIDWFGIYPQPRDWIWQFPVLFFSLQKNFFNFSGISTWTMRLSVVPYLFLIFFLLFLIAKRLYHEKIALLSLFLLTFFSPDLYLSRWALHFHSSTAFFLLAVYFFILSIQDGQKKYFGLLGFALGLCYLTYYSSYLILPLLFFYLILLILKKEIHLSLLKNFLLSLVIFLYTLSPLTIYALKIENFLTPRFEQVKLINGSWSPYKNINTGLQTFEVLKTQTILSVKSLYTDGVGGQGGYLFGGLSLFDKLTFFLILFSSVYFCFSIFKKRKINNFFILVTILACFTTGMILTIPPPAFHRISLAFPFLCLLLSVTLWDFYQFFARRWKKTTLLLFVTVVFFIILSNLLHFEQILAKPVPEDPDYHDYPAILTYLNDHQVKNVYISAFPSYGMGKVFFIQSAGRLKAITSYADEIFTLIPPGQTSYLIILNPDENVFFKAKLAFPDLTIINNYQRHLLLKTN